MDNENARKKREEEEKIAKQHQEVITTKTINLFTSSSFIMVHNRWSTEVATTNSKKVIFDKIN